MQRSPPSSASSLEELIKDYLHELRKPIMYTLEEKIGLGIVETTPINFVLTVSAI